MGYFLAGRVTAVVGTHTHVQTADGNDFVGTYGLYHRCGHDRTGGIYPGRCSTAGAGSVPVPFSYTVHRGQRSLLFERRYHYV